MEVLQMISVAATENIIVEPRCDIRIRDTARADSGQLRGVGMGEKKWGCWFCARSTAAAQVAAIRTELG